MVRKLGQRSAQPDLRVTVRRLLRRLSTLCWVFFFGISFFGVPVQATNEQGLITITEPTDFLFEYFEPTQFLATTFNSDGFQADPQLWLYNADSGELMFTNDDFLGLQSRIDLPLEAGKYRLRASTCCYEPDVWRSDPSGGFNVRYELSFNGDTTSTTTTTEASTTTTELTTTTTTEPETTTTELATTTTTIEPTTTTTTLEPTTTTWPLSTTSTTTPTTTVPITSVPVTTEETTSLPPTVPLTTTPTVPPTSEPSVGPITSVPNVTTSTTTSTIAPIAETTTSTPAQTTTTPETTTTSEAPVATLPNAPDPEQIVEYLTTITSDDLASLNVEQVAELVADIANADLTDEQAEQISEALSNAPDEVKQAFQEAVNVFGGQFDSYVPAGSNVTVLERRTIVAVTAGSMLPLSPVGAGSGGPRRQRKA